MRERKVISTLNAEVTGRWHEVQHTIVKTNIADPRFFNLLSPKETEGWSVNENDVS